METCGFDIGKWKFLSSMFPFQICQNSFWVPFFCFGRFWFASLLFRFVCSFVLGRFRDWNVIDCGGSFASSFVFEFWTWRSRETLFGKVSEILTVEASWILSPTKMWKLRVPLTTLLTLHLLSWCWCCPVLSVGCRSGESVGLMLLVLLSRLSPDLVHSCFWWVFFSASCAASLGAVLSAMLSAASNAVFSAASRVACRVGMCAKMIRDRFDSHTNSHQRGLGSL